MTENEEQLDQHINYYNWMIRPCVSYYDEYSECTSMKGRFHQYFIFGEKIDCAQWKTDYKNCKLYEKENNKVAAVDLIKSERIRKAERLKAHYDNDIWTNRTKPPEEWNKPLPAHILERQSSSILAMHSKEVTGGEIKFPASSTLTCTIL